MIQTYYTEFLTGTFLNWNHLLKEDIYKQVIIDSFQWLAKEKKCIINAFVIMPNPRLTARAGFSSDLENIRRR